MNDSGQSVAEAARFYQDVLGFSITDYIAWDELDAIFLRPARR